jgi:phage terminase large subunit
MTLVVDGHKLISIYEPLSWQIPVLRSIDPVIVLTGAAGGGKSRTAAEKLHLACLHYPGVQALVTRNTRASMTNGTIPFIKRRIIGDDPRVRHIKSESHFEYSNGSMWAYIGLDNEEGRKKLRSFGQDGAADIAWMEEAVENDYEDYNELLSRMRGNAMGWTQILLTTNPDADTHWINVKLIEGGGAKIFYSRTEDNPYNPASYKDTLATMTGVRAMRMREGKWARATGLVYDQWLDDYGQVPHGEETGNVTERAEYIPDSNLTLILGVDDGYAGEVEESTGQFTGSSHPRAFLWCQVSPTGALHIFAENYAVKKLSNIHLDEVLGSSPDTPEEQRVTGMGYPEPQFAVVDKSAAELKGRLHARGIYTQNGAPTVEESIKILQGLLAADINGVRRVLVHPRCRHLRTEMNSYRRDPVTQHPIKEFDHGVDALRYLAYVMRKVYGI